jgi:hypothetical protein
MSPAEVGASSRASEGGGSKRRLSAGLRALGTALASARLNWLLVAVLLGAGAVRLFSLVLHEPLLGYGNNYDMIRVQACHQLWPTAEGYSPATGSPAHPLDMYRFDRSLTIGMRSCLPSSEHLFTYLGEGMTYVLKGASSRPTVPIRLFGFLRALALGTFAVLFSLWFLARGDGRAAIANGLIFAGILTDPSNTLYLNTFYS